MKHKILVIIALFIIQSCAQNGSDYPQDLAGKKALINEKKQEMREMEALIAQLNKEIEQLEPGAEMKAKLVTIQDIERKEFNQYIEVQGSVQSDQLVNVAAEISGRVVRLFVQEGQYVNKGHTIAQLDMETVNKQMAEVETALDLAKNVYERQSRLWEQNIGSEIQYLEAKNNKERLEKNLETLQHQLTKSKVYAPISGVIDREFIKQGEVALPGSPIVQILNTSQVKVVADVPERYLGVVKKGDYVRIEFPALDKEITARVHLLGRTIDPANRTFKLEVLQNNPGGSLKPNLLANIHINDFTEKDAIVIPLNLVQEEVDGREFVFVTGKSPDRLFARKVYVTTGESYDGEIIIRSGLDESEELIVKGARTLIENETIKVRNDNGNDNGNKSHNTSNI